MLWNSLLERIKNISGAGVRITAVWPTIRSETLFRATADPAPVLAAI
jgi:hypothetical protein